MQTQTSTKTHEYFMNIAYQEALKAFDDGEVPIGAVIEKDGVVIGRGYNRIEALQDATAHAEIIAIGAASTKLSTWRLNGASLYVTVEPCIMCLGAILHSRIEAIIYGTSDQRFGSLQTYNYQSIAEKSYTHFPTIIPEVMADDCKALLQTFFKNIRKNH